MGESKPLISDITSESGNEVIETSSFCFNCHKSGTTKLLLTRIPFFREVIISSFECEECGAVDKSVDSAAPVQDQGKIFTLDVRCVKDLNRRIVRTKNSEIILLDSTFPTSEGCLTTIEGVINEIIDNISALQPERKKADPALAAKLEEFLEKIRDLLTVKEHFILKLNDPSGNGFIENYRAPLSDPQLSCTKYFRTPAQNELLGLQPENNVTPSDEKEADTKDGDEVTSSLMDSVSTFQVECPSCHSNCQTNMKLVNIPNFKEVILMAINCEICGYRDSEVKAVTGIAAKGKQYNLRIEEEADLSRDLLKSDTASITIPDIGLQAETGTLGGRFSTVEGILIAIRDQLKTLNPMMFGDSAVVEKNQENLVAVCQKIDQVLAGELKVRMELTDPTGNSYLQTLARDETERDERLEVIEFERTFEQNEELGLNDMKTENYE